MHPILTRKEALKIIHSKDGKLKVSMDLGKSLEEIEVKDGFALVRDQKVEVKAFEKIKDDVCFIIDENELKKCAMFSDETNFYYKLFPTSDWPTITLSSTPMHRHTKISPKKDTETKIFEVYPVKGKVLDTCCGLGYTSIMAAKHADKVHVFERDKNVIHVASFNPYSEELFTNKKIELRNADSYNEIHGFDDEYFDRIIHDPPTFRYSPELYSHDFYKQLYRVLKKDGILYHYAPAPKKTHGEVFYLRIVKALKTVGFKEVEYHEKSSGVRAVKK